MYDLKFKAFLSKSLKIWFYQILKLNLIFHISNTTIGFINKGLLSDSNLFVSFRELVKNMHSKLTGK